MEVKSLRETPSTYTVLHVNYLSIKLKEKDKRKLYLPQRERINFKEIAPTPCLFKAE